MSFGNLFTPSGRQESAELILAQCCGSIGLPLPRNQNLSQRGCRPFGRKVQNAAELYNFIQNAKQKHRMAAYSNCLIDQLELTSKKLVSDRGSSSK